MIHRNLLLRLSRARDQLCENLDEPLTLDEVARDARLSRGELIRRFSAVFGETPYQRRIRARVERAKVLLALGQLSVTEVCLEVGFQSVGSFSDRFARCVGERPSAYRRRVRLQVPTPDGLRAALFPGCLQLMTAAFTQLTYAKRNS